MTAIRRLLARCDAAGVRLFVKDGGALRYEAPDGLDPGFKAELKQNKEELLKYLSAPATETKALQAERAAAIRNEPASVPLVQTLTVMTVAAGERTILVLPSGSPIPPNCVLFMIGNSAFWTPGPAHALWN